MGISDNPIERAMSGEGIPKTDDWNSSTTKFVQ
jgi:hypothetical protein